MIHECAKTKHFFPSAAQALSGVFLAEQIRQQQLASELQKHLQSSSSLTAMQALLNMGKLNSNGNLSAENARKQVIFSLKNVISLGRTQVNPRKHSTDTLLTCQTELLAPNVNAWKILSNSIMDTT